MHFGVLSLKLVRVETKRLQQRTKQAIRRWRLHSTVITIKVVKHLHRELIRRPDNSLKCFHSTKHAYYHSHLG